MASRQVRSGKWKRKTVMEERAKRMNRAKRRCVSGEPTAGREETGSGVGGASTAGREETGSGVGGALTAGREETGSGVGGASTAGREETGSGVGGALTAGREETGSGVGGASTAGREETESVFQGLSDIEDDSASSTDEESFDDEKAQRCYDDWVVSLPSHDRKMLTVALTQSFISRQKMKKTDAVMEAASFVGFNEKTV